MVGRQVHTHKQLTFIVCYVDHSSIREEQAIWRSMELTTQRTMWIICWIVETFHGARFWTPAKIWESIVAIAKWCGLNRRTWTPILTKMAMTMKGFWSQHDPSKKMKNCCGLTAYRNAIDPSLPSLLPKPLWSANAPPHVSELALTLLFQMAQNVKGNQNLPFETAPSSRTLPRALRVLLPTPRINSYLYL